MTKLSPGAQAVRDAVLATYADNIPKDDALWSLERASTVAALRAAANQPYEVPVWIQGEAYWVYRNGVDSERERYLAIADELDNTHPSREDK